MVAYAIAYPRGSVVRVSFYGLRQQLATVLGTMYSRSYSLTELAILLLTALAILFTDKTLDPCVHTENFRKMNHGG